MTNKQIIIDYKNLCENYSKEVGCYGTFDGSCIKEQCFTYKLLQQLQAKEQECERLKEKMGTRCESCKALHIMADDYNDCITENKQLKAENDELRQFLSKEPLAIQALQKSYESYQKSTKVFSDWVKDYQQLITEIKEIAKKRNYLDYNECLDDILQKISEVEE